MQKIEFKDLPDTTTPFTASLFNEMQDNIEDAINEVQNNLLLSSTITLSIGTVNAQDGKYDQSYSLNIPSGYKAFGIIGTNTNGPNSAALTIPKLYIDNNVIRYSVFNSSTSIATANNTSIDVKVLFILE